MGVGKGQLMVVGSGSGLSPFFIRLEILILEQNGQNFEVYLL